MKNKLNIPPFIKKTKKKQADKHTQETTKLTKKNSTGKTQMETCRV
jgi:hypothetical protein